MGNIVADIVEDIEIKPSKTKLVLKWVVAVSGTLIATAFLLGQLKTKYVNRMDRIETNLVEIKSTQRTGFNDVNARIDKVYDDGFNIFHDFQEQNNKQLALIIDYGDDNKEMLKRMLELSSVQQQQQIGTQVEQAKNQPVPSSEISIQRVEDNIPPTSDEYRGMAYFIEIETNDTIFQVTGATMKYYNNVDKNRYEIGALIESEKYPNRHDFAYRNKK